MLKHEDIRVLTFRSLKVYLISFIILCYLWRIFENNILINILLLCGLCIGVHNNGVLLGSKKIIQSNYFLLFLLSIIISIIVASYNLGSFNELVELNKSYTHLTFQNIFEGILIFYLITLNINTINELKVFFNFQLLFTLFFSSLFIVGLSDDFISFFGFNLYSETVFQDVKYELITRSTFETIDASSYGGILSVFFIYSLHKYFVTNDKNKYIYIIICFIFFLSAITTQSRSPILRLIIAFIIYFIFLYGFKREILKYFLFFSLSLIILIIFTEFGNLLYLRIYEVITNISLLYSDGFSGVQDSFQFRIFRSLLGVPETFTGFLFGTGGVQTALIVLKSGYVSEDHIEYTNWLWQYGLFTLIYLLLFIYKIIFKNKININKTKNFEVKSLNAFSISILFSLLVSMITNPQFIYLWIYLGFSIIVLISSKKHSDYITFNKIK